MSAPVHDMRGSHRERESVDADTIVIGSIVVPNWIVCGACNHLFDPIRLHVSLIPMSGDIRGGSAVFELFGKCPSCSWPWHLSPSVFGVANCTA